MTLCCVENCTRPAAVKSRELCSLHYDRWRKTGDPKGTLPNRWHGYDKPTCLVDDCKSIAHSLGYCRSHYSRFKKYGDPLAGRWLKRKMGEGKMWHEAPNGYIVRYEPSNANAFPNGQVYQHRHVMSQMLGRPLLKGENVHHKNGNRADNRPKNLELWVSGQPGGQRVQDVARWAINWLCSEHLQTAVNFDPALRQELRSLARTIERISTHG